MNLINWDNYRGYQLMIGVAQGVYHINGLEEEEKTKTSMSFYDMLGAETDARLEYLAQHYADRHSVLAVLSMLRDEKHAQLIDKTLKQLEEKYPNYAPLMKFKSEREAERAAKQRMEIGQVAPDFSFPTAEGDKNLGPKDFRGKYLVIDFWASWCGPCRNEIPIVKKAYEQFHDKGVEFLSVSIDEGGDEVERSNGRRENALGTSTRSWCRKGYHENIPVHGYTFYYSD